MVSRIECRSVAPALVQGALENRVECVESLYLAGSQVGDCTELYTQNGGFAVLSVLSVVDNYCPVTINESKHTQNNNQNRILEIERQTLRNTTKDTILNAIFQVEGGL